MAKKVDLVGQRFGRLVVLYECDERRNGGVVWCCCCDCGNEINVRSGDLISGHTTSCGCYQRERTAEANTVHGMVRRGKHHPIYRTWYHMLQRCENPNTSNYKYYGGRGIKVYDEWHNAEKFIDWALANGWEKGLQLDRSDSDGNYEPDNCRWVTSKENNRNRRSNHLISFDGKVQTMAEWAEDMNISYSTLFMRINRSHWPIERALTEPVKRRA